MRTGIRPLVIAALLGGLSAAGDSTSAIGTPAAIRQAPEPVIPIEGLDPVLLLRGEERQGKLEIAAEHDGFRYLFATDASRSAFLEDPARFAVQLNGVCARMGPDHPYCHHGQYGPGVGHPEIWAVVGGRIYLFWTLACREAFVKSPGTYLEAATPALAATDAARRRGQALIDRAVAAAGGAERLDALRSLVVSASQPVNTPFGQFPGTLTIHWLLPDRARFELEGGPLTLLQVATPGSGFVRSELKNMGRFETPMTRAQRERHIRTIRLHTDPVGILLARRLPGFQAAALEPAAGTPGDRIAVRVDDLAMTLGLDAAGRIRSMTFTGRNADGALGERVLTFDDFRPVDGLMLAHTVIGAFDGRPDSAWTWTVTSARIDEPVDPALFEQPR